MDTEEIKKYKELYNQFSELFVIYYNEHKEFLTGRRCIDHNAVSRVRRNLKKLIKIEKSMMAAILDIYNVEKRGREEYRLFKKMLSDTAKARSYRPPIRKGKPKNEQHNRTNEDNS